MLNSKKGFTLIELLVVIAIIALLVSIIVPTVQNASSKAKAAADAANLRTILAEVNTRLVGEEDIESLFASMESPPCKTAPGAALRIYYEDPAGVEAYFASGETYYGINYLVQVAEEGSSSLPTAAPAGAGTWYEAGTGKVS